MRNLQIIGAALIIVGAVMLYLLRGPLVSLVVLAFEFLAIVVAVILVLAGVALLVGGHWFRRRFRTRL